MKLLVEQNKLLTVFFPAGAGGHFLVAALALSKHSMLLSEKFILNPRSTEELLDSFIASFNSSIELKKWQDFDMDIVKEIPDSAKLVKLNDKISTDIYFLSAAHDQQHCDSLTSIWKDVTIINFINSAEFNGWRSYPNFPKINDYWKNIQGNDWPSDPPLSYEELQLYPEKIKNEIATKFNNTILNYFNLNSFEVDAAFENEFIPYSELQPDRDNFAVNYPDSLKLLTWNCQDYFSKDATVNSVKRLYNDLGFTDFNKSAISKLYTTWIDTLRILIQHK